MPRKDALKPAQQKLPVLNVKSRTIFGHDNLEILEGINSACIDLIYLDPPFNKKKKFTAPIGSSAEGAEFSDIFREEDIKKEWVETIKYKNTKLYSYLISVENFSTAYNYCYLVYMAIRFIECHRVLKTTGSLYLHCDHTMSHYLKIMLDCIFDEKNFGNEIVYAYGAGGVSKHYFPRKHDIIFLYFKKIKQNLFNRDDKDLRTPYSQSTLDMHYKHEKDGRKYRRQIKNGKEYITYADEGKLMTSVWTDIKAQKATSPISNESKGYPTQKPLELLKRIITASSREGDIVLDPFCGCATTCVAAEKLKRRWIGIDVSYKAYELVKDRLEKEIPLILRNEKEPDYTQIPPKRDDDGLAHVKAGNVYIISNKAFKGYYKVGIAADVKARLNSYQTSDPNRGYKLEYSIESVYYKEIEKHIHNKFDNKLEWVEGDLHKIKTEIYNYKSTK